MFASAHAPGGSSVSPADNMTFTEACAILGIVAADVIAAKSSNSGGSLVDAAYRAKARQFHPDKQTGLSAEESQRARDEFERVKAARFVVSEHAGHVGEIRNRLSGTNLGASLDKFFMSTSMNFGSFGQVGVATTGSTSQSSDISASGISPEQQSQKRVSAAGQPPVKKKPKVARSRGNDLRASINVSFRESLKEQTKSIAFSCRARCQECAAAGLAWKAETESNQANSESCATCSGTHFVVERRVEEVTLPSCIHGEWKTVLAEKGEPDLANPDGLPGDLQVVVNVEEDPFFRWASSDTDSLDCIMPVSIPLFLSVLGGLLEMRTMYDEIVTIKVPPGTRSGDIQRVENIGFQKGRHVGAGMVIFHVELPEVNSLSERQRDLLRQLEQSEKFPNNHGHVMKIQPS